MFFDKYDGRDELKFAAEYCNDPTGNEMLAGVVSALAASIPIPPALCNNSGICTMNLSPFMNAFVRVNTNFINTPELTFGKSLSFGGTYTFTAGFIFIFLHDSGYLESRLFAAIAGCNISRTVVDPDLDVVNVIVPVCPVPASVAAPNLTL